MQFVDVIISSRINHVYTYKNSYVVLITELQQ